MKFGLKKWLIFICLNLGLASLQHVFDSLTENGKGVLKLIIKEQINQMAKQKDGPNFKGREKNFTEFSGGRSKVVVKQFLT